MFLIQYNAYLRYNKLHSNNQPTSSTTEQLKVVISNIYLINKIDFSQLFLLYTILINIYIKKICKSLIYRHLAEFF